MFSLDDLSIPIMAAPMAGGPSTPELVAAVTNAGGTGFLAAGYQTADALAADIDRARSLTSAAFGVNLFMPAEHTHRDPETATRLDDYRKELEQEASRYECELPEPNPADRDRWEEKIAILLENPVAFVSTTFGCPDVETIARLQGVGIAVIVTVSDEQEAIIATDRGANALCVQGPNAGGHRGTDDVAKEPDARSLEDLLLAIRTVTDLPLIAAGGISRPEHVAAALRSGALAVQVGTILLRSPESGASLFYKEALADGGFTETKVSRAFSGRWARALINRFIRDHDVAAAAAYPEVNQMTRPIRSAAAASGDVEGMSLWAGTGFRDAEAIPAAEIVSRLWGDV